MRWAPGGFHNRGGERPVVESAWTEELDIVAIPLALGVHRLAYG